MQLWTQTIADLITLLRPYWGWLSTVVILALIGETLKRHVFTADLIEVSRIARWWRRTMPIHPVVGGMLIGLVPGVPLPDDVSGTVQAVLYYGAAGAFSVWAYDVARTAEKYARLEVSDETEDDT